MQHPADILLAERKIRLPSAIPTGSLKAGYAARKSSDTASRSRHNRRTRHCRFIPQAVNKGRMRNRILLLHALGPPRKQGHRPHAIVDRPATLTPSINPRLGVESQHKELHRCALRRIFRPALKMVDRLEYCTTHQCLIANHYTIVAQTRESG